MRLADEKDIDIVRKAATLLERENQRLVQKVLDLTRELSRLKGEDARGMQLRIAELEQQLATRNKMLFGSSSEKRGNAVDTTSGDEPKAKLSGHGPREQTELPIAERTHTLDEADQTCPSCGGALEAWPGQFEESEEIDVLARRFILIKHRRQKYVCRCGACVDTALGPEKLCDGARYSIDFAVEVATSKYLDHLPLERQVRVMRREGLVVDSQTLWDQIERLARPLAPVLARLHAHILSHGVVGADETRWPMVNQKQSENARWQVWIASCPNALFYKIQADRSAKSAAELLPDYKGVVMCDGYGAYDSLAKDSGGALVLAHCWSHVRRKFVEIEEHFPTQAREALDLIGELYAIDAECPTGPPHPVRDALRAKLRAERSRDVVRHIQAWALGVDALPQSALAKALAYMAGMWTGLVRFLDDPRIPLDNNATERAARGPVVGRKNHYGSRSRRGTEVAALFYSLLESAKLADVEPKAYLQLAARAALRGEVAPLPHEVVVDG
jgi:transposase